MFTKSLFILFCLFFLYNILIHLLSKQFSNLFISLENPVLGLVVFITYLYKMLAKKKPVAKKAPAKKACAKKVAVKKPVAKKAPAKKPVAKKAPVKKVAVKKPVAKKAPAKKPVAKKK